MARAAAAWERRAARRTDLIVCVSEGERATGQRAGIRGHCVVVHNGVDLTVFTPASDQDRTEARRKLGLPDVPITVCVGRLSPAKGQDILLRAWPAVRERVPTAVLYLVGAFEERDAAEGVEFVGHQESVTEWLAAADVVASPSRWEAMSLALLEAMARGRSVVASDVGGNREAMGAGSGAIVPPEEPRPLADAIVARLLDPDLVVARVELPRHAPARTTSAGRPSRSSRCTRRRCPVEAASSGRSRKRRRGGDGESLRRARDDVRHRVDPRPSEQSRRARGVFSHGVRRWR